MTKKGDNVLALPPMKSGFSPGSGTGLDPHASNRPLRKREKQIIRLSQEQRSVMELTADNARFGMTMISRIHEHASLTFEETAAYIVDTRNQPGRDEEHQAYIDQFSLRQIQLCAQQMLAVIDVSATGIGMEIHRSLYPPPEDPPSEEPKGFFARLFGKHEDY